MLSKSLLTRQNKWGLSALRAFGSYHSTDLAMPAYEYQKPTNEQLLDQLRSYSLDITLGQLTEFVDRNLNGNNLLLGENDDEFFDSDYDYYWRLIDEVVLLAKEWMYQHHYENATIEQMRVLILFGTQFNIQDHQFWSQVRQSTENLIQARPQSISTDDLLSIAHQLMKKEIISSPVLTRVMSIALSPETLNSAQLVSLVEIYGLNQKLVDIDTLEDSLITRISELSAE